MSAVEIDVRHVARVEGHGNIRVRVSDGELTHVELAIVESPRFFEAFMRGRRYDEAPHIACRICGICSIGHTLAAIKAIEAACGIHVDAQTLRLRKLALMGEQIQSHVLHLYFLAVPDFLGVPSVIPLAATHPDVVRRALRMKKLANDVCAVAAGRHIHPIAMRVGGFTHVPSPEAARELRQRLEDSRADLRETVELVVGLDMPAFSRPTEYVALRDDAEYAFYDGQIVSTLDPSPTPVAEYRQRVIESVVQRSSAKHCRSPGSESYAVGALARFNNNRARLHESAAAAAQRLGLNGPSDNPFHNNAAQLVETVHCIETAIELIRGALADPPRLHEPEKPHLFGTGVGAVEAPRGLLLHEYAIDSGGRIESANLIIPTGQNLANIEADMRQFVLRMLDGRANEDFMRQRLEMLVRAYDPCISCATHFLEIDWE